MSSGLELGLDTFGEVSVDDHAHPVSQSQVIRDIVEEGVLADHVGVQHFGIGEHHRDDFAVSAPDMLLAAIASRTSTIQLGSSVTVLSSDDPVRVFQRFATLDAISAGRAEVTVGRGSFTESFPLFGYDLSDYDILFEEKLDLLTHLSREAPVTWSGTTRASLTNQRIYPFTQSGRLPVWVGVGGSLESVVRTARYGLPMMVAIIGGSPARLLPLVNLYRTSVREFGFGALAVGVHSGGFIAATDRGARDTLYPYYKAGRDRIGAERGWPLVTREQYDQDIDHGSLTGTICHSWTPGGR